MNSFSESYKNAGVDITAGYRSVELIKKHVASTYNEGVMSDIGDFGGLYDPSFLGYKHPVFVSGTDGVGTKLKIAFLMDKHDTVGIDCVAMCVNDVVCSGARPLFFLDYIALGKNVPEKVADIVKGIAAGCRESGCALIGGETAEMPGFYPEDEYDLAGFTVGAVDRDKILDKNLVAEGDALIALPSTGFHSNGYSLVRKIFDVERPGALDRYSDELGSTVGEALLTPTALYVRPLLDLIERVGIRSAANITGGGFYENIPRCLPKGLGADIDKSSLRIPPLFGIAAKLGDIPERDMFNTFNMGVGMVVVVDPLLADRAIDALKNDGIDAYCIGVVKSNDNGVTIR